MVARPIGLGPRIEKGLPAGDLVIGHVVQVELEAERPHDREQGQVAPPRPGHEVDHEQRDDHDGRGAQVGLLEHQRHDGAHDNAQGDQAAQRVAQIGALPGEPMRRIQDQADLGHFARLDLQQAREPQPAPRAVVHDTQVRVQQQQQQDARQ